MAIAAVDGHTAVVVAVMFVDVVGLIGILAGCASLYYLSSRIEPHWVAKDLSRFLTPAQELDDRQVPIGRRKDVRVHIDDESDALLVSRRSMLRPNTGMWTVKSKQPATSRGRFVYVLRPASPTTDAAMLALRVPADSKVVPRLEELLELTGDEATMRRARQQRRAEHGDAEVTGASDSPGSRPPDRPTDRG